MVLKILYALARHVVLAQMVILGCIVNVLNVLITAIFVKMILAALHVFLFITIKLETAKDVWINVLFVITIKNANNALQITYFPKTSPNAHKNLVKLEQTVPKRANILLVAILHKE